MTQEEGATASPTHQTTVPRSKMEVTQPPDSSKPDATPVTPQPTKPPSQTQQLEDELELDLENMKIDENIDTSVRH